MKTGELAPTAREARILRMLRAVANPARFRIVVLLAERKDYTSAPLSEALPLAQSILFAHLALLPQPGIVPVTGNPPHPYYSLDPPPPPSPPPPLPALAHP